MRIIFCRCAGVGASAAQAAASAVRWLLHAKAVKRTLLPPGKACGHSLQIMGYMVEKHRNILYNTMLDRIMPRM